MHEKSLPIGDRVEPARSMAEPPHQESAALIIGLRRRRGGFISVRSMSRARLFSAQATELVVQTIARLRRKKIAAVVVTVKVIVGR